MKRSMSIAAAMLLVFSMILTGCGKSSSNNTQPTNTAGIPKDQIKVGFIYVGPANDGGWSQAQDEGRKYLVQQLGVQTVIKEIVSDANADSEQVMKDMIDQGCNVIFATSFGYQEHVAKVAKDYPNVKFYHCSGSISGPNITTYFGRMYEARYLSGIVAGMKTKTNRIGYVAAFETPEVISGANAFALGVQSVNPNAKVVVQWTHTWIDAEKEKNAAVALLNDKCDVIAQHNDSTSPQVAAEQKGSYAIGYNLDNKAAAPKAYMTAPIWNWGPYFVSEINTIIAGTWKASDFHGGIKEGTLDLAPLTDVAPADANAKVQDIRKQIVDGTFQVFAGEIKDQSGNIKVEKGKYLEYNDIMGVGMNWFVPNIEGTIKTN